MEEHDYEYMAGYARRQAQYLREKAWKAADPVYARELQRMMRQCYMKAQWYAQRALLAEVTA